ncbi:MAG: hypothetical protein LW834_20370 [Cyanobium sp. 49614_E6]|nr:hypothetical protein [Cyanobium sp. 49614_E6]
MTTSHSPAAVSPSSSNGESLSSLPRWRQWLSMLNWRRDPDYEQRKMQHELRMQQLKSEIEQIEKETEQLRRENAKQKALSALIKQHCFPPESSSTPIPPIEPGSSSS